MSDHLFVDRSFAAFLFDMDGTILSSIQAAERVWAQWATRFGIDVAAFLPTIHGARAVDTIRRLAIPGVDAEAEAAAITQAELQDVAGIHPIAGALAFLASLPADRWAVVTSAPRELALRRLVAAGLSVPDVLVTSEDIAHGKPDPACFNLAATRLGCSARDCLVFEDASPGILAAEAAGAAVVVITATHRHSVHTRHASSPDFTTLRAVVDGHGKLQLLQR